MVKDVISPDANTIFGATVDEKYNDRIIVTIVATGFEGSRFENATNSSRQNFDVRQTQNFNQNQRPQENGNFDKNNFNNFANNKVSNSLFDRNFGTATPSMPQNSEPQKRYDNSTSMDLWSRLNSDTPSQSSDRITNYDEAALDRKYGLNSDNRNMQNYSQNLYNQAKGQPQGNGMQSGNGMNNNSGIQSGIKVDDVEIPPFLRRKFNK